MKIYSNDELVFNLPADGEGKASAMLRPCLEYKVITTGDGFPQHEQVIKSNCPVSKKDDIRILMKRPKLYVNVFDKYSNKDISNAQVELQDLTSKTQAINAETDAKGYVRFYLEPCHQYQIRAKKAGLPDAMKTLTAPCKQGEVDAVARLGTGVAPLKGIPLEFTIVDEQSNAPVANAKIRMVNTQTKEVLDFLADEKGFFETVVNENSSWTASCSQIGYFSTSKSKTDVKALKGIKKLSRELKLLKLREGGVIALEGIFYDLAKSNIRQDAAKVLDYVVLVMEENPTMIIELGSHTDSRGSDADNLKLSEARAKSAAEYIVSKGISASRISGKGYGETQLKNSCGNGVKCKEAQHQENRRTEIRILDFD
jgi:outer membrane protein OmpA-like peptidoglycan-associated protein